MIYLSCSVLHCSPKLITVYWSRGGGHEAQTQCMHFLLRSYCGKHTLKPFIPQNSAVGPNQRLHGLVSSRPSYSLSMGTDSTFTSPCPCRNPRSRLRLRSLALDFAFASILRMVARAAGYVDVGNNCLIPKTKHLATSISWLVDSW